MLPIAGLLHACTGVGQTYGVSVFNPYFLRELRLTSTQLSMAYMVASLAAALPLPWVGRLADRFGLRATAVAGIVCLGMACAAAGWATGVVSLAVAFFLLRLLGPGVLSLVASNTVAMWFSRRLGLAGGVVGLVQSAAFSILPPVYTAVAASQGRRAGYTLLGLATLAVMLPLVLFVYKNRPADVGQRPDGDEEGRVPKVRRPAPPVAARSYTAAEARRTAAFRVPLAARSLWGLIGTGLFFHAVTILGARGVTAAEAATLFTAFGVTMAAGLAVGGPLADRLRPAWLFGTFGLLTASGTAMLWAADSAADAWAVGAVLGTGQGVLSAVLNTVWPRFFGTDHLGAIRGTVTTVASASAALGPVIVGLSMDHLGGAGPALGLFVALLLGLAAASPWVRPPA